MKVEDYWGVKPKPKYIPIDRNNIFELKVGDIIIDPLRGVPCKIRSISASRGYPSSFKLIDLESGEYYTFGAFDLISDWSIKEIVYSEKIAPPTLFREEVDRALNRTRIIP